MKTLFKVILIGVAALIMILIIGGIFGVGRNPKSETPSAASTKAKVDEAKTVEAKTVEAKAEPGSQWRYSENEDAMGRKKSSASVDSTNSLDFKFPYQGSQNGTLTLRKSAESGTEVLLGIEKGQFLCTTGCNFNVRFDDGPIQRFSGNGPESHSSTIVFISSEKKFVSQLQKAKIVRIEATFYQEGSNILEFKTEGFKWN